MGNANQSSVIKIPSSRDPVTIEGNVDSRRLEVKRTFPYTVEQVWNAIVDPDSVSKWWGDWSIEAHEGGKVQLKFGSTIVPGTIKTFMPPHVFAWIWEQDGEEPSLVQFDLVEVGEETLLTVVQTPLSCKGAGDCAAGWHSMMDRLSYFLSSGQYAPQDTARWKELYSIYSKQS